MLRRVLIIFLVSCMLFAAGCSQTAHRDAETDRTQENQVQPYEKTDEVVEITFWTCTVEEVNQQLADMFNETRGKELNIHVTPVYQGDYYEAEQKINSASIAGTLPNVFVDEVAMTHGFAEDEVIVNLEPYITANDFDNSVFTIGDTGNLFVDGQMYAFPHFRSLPVMYINDSLLDRLSGDLKAPESFDELEEFLQDVYDQTGKAPTTLMMNETWIIEALLLSYSNAALFNEDETECYINREGAVRLVEYIDNLYEKGLVDMLGPTDMNTYYASVVDPDMAMIFQSIGVYVMATETMWGPSGLAFSVHMIPAGEDGTIGVPVGGANLYLGNTGTDNEKAAAFEFMKWVSEPEQSAFASVNTGYLPTQQSAMETETLQNGIARYPGIEVAFEELQYSSLRPTSGEFVEIEDLMSQRLMEIWTENLDIKPSLDELAEEVNAILNR